MEPKTEVVVSIIAYSLCSGTLVLLNKLILHNLPYPSLVISFQLVAALVFIASAKYLGILAVDPIRCKFVVPYLYYIIAFALGVYCNMKSLSMSNVETVIVFRALSPCVVAFLDAMFLGREYPSRKSWAGLLAIVVGAYGYASFDVKFQTQGMAAYSWPFLYLCLISFEMAYGKRIIRSVDLKTKSGPVLYTNMLGLAPMLLFAAMGHEFSHFATDRAEGKRPITVAAILLLLLGCAAGTGIGYSSWWCRDKVSATTFTLIGVMNKCLTVLLNLLIWDKHAPPAGILSLVVCLIGGTFYRQAPLRSGSSSSSSSSMSMSSKQLVAAEVDDVWEADISMTGAEKDEEEQLELLPESPVKTSASSPSTPDGVKRRAAA